MKKTEFENLDLIPGRLSLYIYESVIASRWNDVQHRRMNLKNRTVIQWLPSQEEFITNSFAMLNENGILAAQIPLFEEMPANECIIKAEKILADKFKGIEKDKFVLHSAQTYYDMVAKPTDKIEMWITDYCHEMDSPKNILEFLRETALHPYVELLNEEEQKLFLGEVLRNLENAYHYQANGKVLFPFKRPFLLGQK